MKLEFFPSVKKIIECYFEKIYNPQKNDSFSDLNYFLPHEKENKSLFLRNMDTSYLKVE